MKLSKNKIREVIRKVIKEEVGGNELDRKQLVETAISSINVLSATLQKLANLEDKRDLPSKDRARSMLRIAEDCDDLLSMLSDTPVSDATIKWPVGANDYPDATIRWPNKAK
jgi:hypothetical protein